MAGSKPLIQIKPEYTRTVRRIKAGATWDAQIPKPMANQPNDTYFNETRAPWSVNKTVCLYDVEPWSFSLSEPTMKRLFAWCEAKNLSLLEYGYCIVIEQQETGAVHRHQACFLFKKLRHALLFKLSWNGITDETSKEL